jgi:hypothetical protein
MHIHPSLPYADGICFDDIEGFDIEHTNHLAASGTIYITEFKANGRRYGGRIIARSQERAEEIAFGRGLGEEVLGRLVLTGRIN